MSFDVLLALGFIILPNEKTDVHKIWRISFLKGVVFGLICIFACYEHTYLGSSFGVALTSRVFDWKEIEFYSSWLRGSAVISVGICLFLTISYPFSAIYFHVKNVLPPSVYTQFAIVATLANDLLNCGLNICVVAVTILFFISYTLETFCHLFVRLKDFANQ